MSDLNQAIRFLFAGVINTIFGYVAYSLLLISGLPLILAVVASMIAAFLFNFLTYGKLVFRDLSKENLPRFLAFYILFGTFNYCSLLLIEYLGVKPILGQALLLPVLAVLCYVGLRLFVFRARGRTTPRGLHERQET